MLMPSLPIGSSEPQVSDSGSGDRAQLKLSVSQIPEKSGLPSRVRGVGAVRLGFPSGERGTPAVGYFRYCATRGDAQRKLATVNASATEGIRRLCMGSPEELYVLAYQTLTVKVIRGFARHPLLSPSNRSDD